MTDRLPKLVATSVVRGSQQGDSHGGIFTIDFEAQDVRQHVDWNTGEIDFEGRGADRGLRGIAFDRDDIYVAASDELFRYDRDFRITGSYRNRYLKHCHEISRMDRTLFLTSTGFDSLLAFDLDRNDFIWGMQIARALNGWAGTVFDPRTAAGPAPSNHFHVNMVHVDGSGVYVSGLRTKAMLHINSKFELNEVCNIPQGAHNAQPYRNGVLVNDTQSDAVRYSDRDGTNKAFAIVTYDEEDIEFSGIDDSKIARQGFGRGLCPVGERLVAGGSSPSTISLYDIDSEQMVATVNLTMDIRNAIHGLEVWPYDN
ncbi:MAG: hypothetical protein GTO71_11395 [Woeseiaceae bacterium]|nr:hypothetical protein [Woeseiaceae bacterium]NIP21671.1 hypothetical protein [Woeseiaceae bacterium]NIS90757.1 hypothetical protein [Woeseiaceae bacterium]